MDKTDFKPYARPECRLTELLPRHSVLSDANFYPFEDEDYSEGGEYIW